MYRLLLLAYPARFRREFGVEMVQVLRDDMRSTLQERGSWGLTGRWLLILIDLVRSAFAEHIWEVFHMPVHSLARWNGAAAALGGALFVFIAVFDSAGIAAGDDFFRFLLFLLPLVLLWGIGLGGLYRHLPRSAHTARRIAAGTALLSLFFIAAGVLLLDLTESDAAWGLLMVGFYGLVAGIAGMGVITLVHHTLGIWRFIPLLLAASLLGFIVFGNANDIQDNPAQFVSVVVNGACWLLLGIALWTGGRETPAAGFPA